MSMFETEGPQAAARGVAVPTSEIDSALTAQLVVAWAGERGQAPRLGWWRSDLVSEFGGEDLFQQMLPHTWRWAVLQGAREAATRTDAELRRQDHAADRIVSLFALGFELDERLDERLLDLKRSGKPPQEALPELAHGVQASWSREHFIDWVAGHGEEAAITAPIGRRLKGPPPTGLGQTIQRLVAALAPLGDIYPLPHFRRPS